MKPRRNFFAKLDRRIAMWNTHTTLNASQDWKPIFYETLKFRLENK